MGEIRFCRATGEYGWLSNRYMAEVRFHGILFSCAEMAYLFGKPADTRIRDWMMSAPTVTLCAQLAHALLPWQVDKDWSANKVDRMRAVLLAKFTQRADLRGKLLATGDAVLIEESDTDAFWGVGKKGAGKNMLGVLLMELRDGLRKEGACS